MLPAFLYPRRVGKFPRGGEHTVPLTCRLNSPGAPGGAWPTPRTEGCEERTPRGSGVRLTTGAVIGARGINVSGN